MEFPDTTLNSALSDHLSRSLTGHLNNPDGIDDLMRKKKTPADTLPLNLASSLLTTLGSGRGHAGTFDCHTGFHNASAFEKTNCLTKEMFDQARETLTTCLDQVEIIRNSLRRGFMDKVSDLCNRVNVAHLTKELTTPIDKPDDVLVDRYCRAAYWQSLVNTAAQPGALGTSWKRGIDSFINRHATVVLISSRWVVMPHDALLMIKDVMWGIFLTTLYARIDKRRAYIERIMIYHHEWSKDGLRLYGDLAYNLIKSIEPLCTMRLICLSERYLDSNKQAKKMLGELSDKEIEIRMQRSMPPLHRHTMATKMWDFLETLTDPNMISELFSLLKMAGHPYIDPIQGSLAIEKLAKADSSASYVGIKAVGWSFCHMFVKGYTDKMKRWPPLIFDLPPGKESILKQMADTQHMPLPLGLSLYDPSDWDYCTFLPIDEFDYGADILSLMTDKSLSFKRSEVDNSWRGRLPYSPPKATSSSRVLEQLLTDDLDLKEICRLVSSGDIPFDWRIVTIHPKEREMKAIIARMFAIMVIEMRTFFCLLEENLSSKIFPFIPEQTMTMDQADKEELFLKLTSERENQCTLSIGIDLAKWCSHFRKYTVMMVADRLNQLLGVEGLYGFVHDFFMMSIIVLRHPAFTPKQDTRDKRGNLEEEPGIYTGAEAGLEGIAQKMWTLVTLCMLHWAVWRFGFSYKITCQGDNLVIYITLTKTKTESEIEFGERVRVINQKVLESISSAAEMIGHDVKPDECFSSTGFMTYGKDMWFRGVKLETCMKVITRMFAKTTTDTPSTESIIANISATGTSLVERTNSPLSAFLFTKGVESLVIDRELRGSIVHGTKFQRMPNLFFWNQDIYGGRLLLTLVPQNLGGLPISTLAEFMYRGHSDPLSSSLGSVSIFNSIPIVRKFLACLEQERFVSLTYDGEELDIARLIRDPFSIPLRQVSQGATLSTARNVRELLRTCTRNKLLTPIVNLSADTTEERRLIDSLLTTKPINPKVLHEIHKLSVFGLSGAIALRFTNTRTLRRMTQRSDIDLISSHIFNDLEKIKSIFRFLSQVSRVGKVEPSMHPHQLLVMSREKWGLGTLEGVTNYHPLIAGTLIPTQWMSPSVLREIIDDESQALMIVMSLTSSAANCRTIRGVVHPFLGNSTSEKTASKYTKPIDASPPLKDALKLIQIAKLCTSLGSAMRDLLDQLAVQRTSLPLSILYEMAKEQIGGTLSHRLETSASPSGSRMASLPNWATHFTVSSNLSREMGQVDYPVSYSEYYLALLCCSEFFAPSDLPPPFGVVQVVNLNPLTPVQDQEIVLPCLFSVAKVSVPRDSYYLYATSVTISTRDRLGKQLPLDTISVSEGSVTDGLSVIMISLLTKGVQLVRKQGYIRSTISHKHFIDLPEAGLVELHEYLRAAGLACWITGSREIIGRLHKNSDRNELCKLVLIKQAMILAPQIFNSVALAHGNIDPHLRLSAGSHVNERGLIRLCCLITEQALTTSTRIQPPPLFELGKGAMSTAVGNRVYYLILQQALRGSSSVPVAKFLARIVHSVLSKPSEELRIDGLTQLLSLTGLDKGLRRDVGSAERTVRMTRNRAIIRIQRQMPIAMTFLKPSRTGTLTDGPLILSSVSYRIPTGKLIDSWHKRPHPGRSDSHLKWGPITRFLPPGSSVYVIGVGAGGILACIPDQCKVTGLDLPESVQCLGQNFVNYTCSTYHPGYITSPLTWLSNCSDLYSSNWDDLIQDLSQSGATHVIIDVDRLSLHERVSLRNRIAQTGRECWVRAFGSEDEITQLVQSVGAMSAERDAWWEPAVSCGLELIYGCGSRPLGTLIALGGIERVVVRSDLEYPSWDEQLEFVMAFGGDIRCLTQLDLFVTGDNLSRQGEGARNPIDMYMLLLNDPDLALKLYGRMLCRIVVSIMRWEV